METPIVTNVQLITNEVSFKNNKLPDGQFTLAPRFTRNIWVEGNTGFVELICEILNSEEHRFPVDVRVSLSGVFDMANIPDDQKDAFLKVSAVQIIFPYVRGIVSSISTSALMPPIVLPIIDVRKLFPEENG